MPNDDSIHSVWATENYSPQYPDPISVPAGTIVYIDRDDSDNPGWWWCIAPDGRAGWVPAELLDPVPTANTRALVRLQYSARELPLNRGEQLVVEVEYAGWLYVRNDAGMRGWVPVTHVATKPL